MVNRWVGVIILAATLVSSPCCESRYEHVPPPTPEENIRLVELGYSKESVRTLMGSPASIRQEERGEVWVYGEELYVSFNDRGLVKYKSRGWR